MKADSLPKGSLFRILPDATTLAEEVHEANQRLRDFENQLIAAQDGPLYIERNSPLYTFCDVETGRLLTLYWATCSLLWAGIADLHSTLRELSFLNLPGNDVPRINKILAQPPENWIEAVRKVLQSIESCDLQDTSGTGQTRVAVPLVSPIDL